VSEPEVLALEEAAFAAWPAALVRALGPWRLRFMHGITNRGNSAWAGPGKLPVSLDAGIRDVERFYTAHALPATFQLTPLSDSRLDARLAECGYRIVDPTSVQWAPAATVARLPAPPGTCESELPEEWFDLSGRRGRFHGPASDVYRALLERLKGRAGFASARDAQGRLAAVGLTVVAPPLAGVFSMLTLAEARRRGLAAAVLGAIARFAAARGVRQLYLQVEKDNAPALALYAGAGFRESHPYHYRRRDL
jgi:ribosomal protein S18 acetylase RimI-like enzyme